MIFNFKADCDFEAEDIDDACRKLSKHFKDVRDFKESDLIGTGEMEVIPLLVPQGAKWKLKSLNLNTTNI